MQLSTYFTELLQSMQDRSTLQVACCRDIQDFERKYESSLQVFAS